MSEPKAGTSSVAPIATQDVAGISLSLKVPPFWRDKPRLWFISFEATTSHLKRNQTELARMVIAQLDKEDIEEISDLLYDPSETNQYQILKDRLISIYEDSDSKQLQRLLSYTELGDQKPSQLLRRMRDLARKKIPDETLKLMWMNLLPTHIRSMLIVSETCKSQADLSDLAALADRMVETSQEVATVSKQPSSTPSDTQILLEEVKKLSLEVAAIRSTQGNRQYYQRRGRTYPSRPNTGNASYPRSNSPSPYCYYHRRFGKYARCCTSPCSFTKQPKEN